MSDIFISYSRKDLEFVNKLNKALSGDKNRDVWVDLEDIPPASKWRQEISEAIDAADNFVFIITPDSIASKECGKELAHAIQQHKRLIALVCREVELDTVPKPLAELNFIYCRKREEFTDAVGYLVAAVDTDLDWVKEHTRILTRAMEWERQGKNNSLLLRGDDLDSSESWMSQGGIKKPAPNALQGQFIHASRQDENARHRLEQKRAEIALGAFYRLTYDIRENLIDIPGTSLIRRQFIEGNIRELHELVEVSPDAKAMRELATNYRALAEILWKDNELDKAVQAYQTSNKLTRPLAEQNPSESLYWHDLAAGHMNLGLLALPSNQDEALDEYNKALEAAENAARLNPQWAGLLDDLKSRIAGLCDQK